MSKDKKPNPSKIRISPWVIYGAVLLILIAIQLVSSGTNFQEVKPTTLSKFYQYLDSGQVDKVVFNKSTAQVFLKKEALSSKTHAKVEKKNLLGKENTGPHYTLDIGTNSELFQKKLEEARLEGKLNDYSSEPESNWGDILINFLPIILIIAFWLFMFRRMSGGGSGGGGGQIFSIGKSKAKLFDEKNDIKVTFKDVAGLEGAKEEIQEIVEFLKQPEKYTSIGGKIPKEPYWLVLREPEKHYWQKP